MEHGVFRQLSVQANLKACAGHFSCSRGTTAMTDKQDSGDEMQAISRKFRSVTTLEPAFNNGSTAKQTKPVKPTCSSSAGKSGPHTTEDGVAVRNLPEINLPEKILLVVDAVRERDFTPFKLGTGTVYPPLFMIRRAIQHFIYAKSSINQAHEFALMKLTTDGAQWVSDFTGNTKAIANKLETIVDEVLEAEQKTYDLGQLFEKIIARLPTPQRSNIGALPRFVTRVILIYTRSNSLPKFETGCNYLQGLTQNPYFFLDALFVHEPACAKNACEEVYAEITALDTTNYSYILEVGRNAAMLHDNMAKLLAHPLQRPPQKDAQYSISCASTLPLEH